MRIGAVGMTDQAIDPPDRVADPGQEVVMRKTLLTMILALLASTGAVAAVDANGDGKVTLDELTDYKLEQAPFAAGDRNHDGYLDPVELPELTNDETLTAYDSDHDGKLSPTEYRTFITDFAIAAMAICAKNEDDILTGSEIGCGIQSAVPKSN